MNEQTTQLIEQLAKKLGTSAEYLWDVLIKQAPISAATDLLYLILVIIGGWVLWKFHKRFNKKVDGNESMYEEGGELLIPVIIFVAIIWAIIFIVCFFSIGNIINGFFNPEFWALREVLSAIK